MSTIQFTPETLDIRDINPGEIYFAIASKENGGRCVNNGWFPSRLALQIRRQNCGGWQP